MAPVGSGGARSASACPVQLTPMVGPGVAVLTTSETLVLCVAVEETPVIVRVNVPTAVAAVVDTVRVEAPPATTAAGANVPVAPDGNPASDRLTVSATPEVTCVFTA